jgi:hypothetical protein
MIQYSEMRGVDNFKIHILMLWIEFSWLGLESAAVNTVPYYRVPCIEVIWFAI